MKQKTKRKLSFFIIGFAILLSSLSVYFYRAIYRPNINTDYRANDGSVVMAKPMVIYIPEGISFDELATRLKTKYQIIGDMTSFYMVAKFKGYQNNIKSGYFVVNTKMSNNDFINLIRVKRRLERTITFNNMRKIDELPELVSEHMCFFADSLRKMLNSDSVAKSYGFTKETFGCMFIPNTYQVYFDYNETDFLDRMKREYDKYWTPDKIKKQKALGLSKIKVSILASIVQSESQHGPELRRIAGVYINRLNKNMLLQADPTVVFAHNDFTIKRVLNKHLEIDSPYNTYKNTGLPPGPIKIPSTKYLDAVLDYEEHNYIYFCASEKFDGSHNFAKTLTEHNRNARIYQKELTKRNIK